MSVLAEAGQQQVGFGNHLHITAASAPVSGIDRFSIARVAC